MPPLVNVTNKLGTGARRRLSQRKRHSPAKRTKATPTTVTDSPANLPRRTRSQRATDKRGGSRNQIRKVRQPVDHNEFVRITAHLKRGRSSWQYQVRLQGDKLWMEIWVNETALQPWKDLLLEYKRCMGLGQARHTRTPELVRVRVSAESSEEEDHDSSRGRAGSVSFDNAIEEYSNDEAAPSDTDGTPASDDIEESSEEGMYEVQKVVDHRMIGRDWLYRVRWVACGEEEDSWLPISRLEHCRQLVTDFHNRRRGKIQGGAKGNTRRC